MQVAAARRRIHAAAPAILAAAAIVAATTLVHLWLAIGLPLAPDETYYWEWSRRPSLGYYDQGPMIAWWIRGSCALFGSTALGVRFGIVLASLATQVLLYLLARDLYGERVALGALILSSVTPIAMAGGFIATYDPLLSLFWVAASYAAARALLCGSTKAWAATGIAFGLGLLSKHTMALFAPCLLAFLAADQRGRRWLRRPEPYLACLLGIVVFAPNLWWQSQHDWMTFRHLFAIAGRDNHTAIRRIGDYIGSQAGLLTPLLFLAFIAAITSAWRNRSGADERSRYLVAMSPPVLVFFLLVAMKSKVQANWAICGWLTPPILYAAQLCGVGARRRGAALAFAGAAAVLAAAASSLLLAPGLRGALGVRIPARWDQTNRLYGGAELAGAVDAERGAMAAETHGPVIPAAATYDTASWMAFYMAGQPAVHCLFAGTRMNSYILWNKGSGLQPGGNAIMADGLAPDDPKLPPIRMLFARVIPAAQPLEIRRPGVYDAPIHTYYLYRCYGYRPNPAVERPKGG